MAKVMLIEDDATMRSLLQTLLEIEGFEVLLPPVNMPGTQIIENIKEQKPDALMLDINLKDVSGIDVVKQVRQDNKIKKLKVVMASGMDLKDDCLKAGADNFFLKPYMPEDLINWLKKAIG